MRLQLDSAALDDSLRRITHLVHEAGGRALVVGGSVRDALLGLPVKDLDLEVFGLAPSRLEELLDKTFRIDRVGQSFGVLKLKGLAIDVSIPRRESKHGLGHKGFEIQSDPTLSLEDAASRRDFTVNAMAFDPLTEQLLDPWNGLRDLEAGVLRHVSEKFSEDPLRVLRAMQFAARFDFAVAPETVGLCRTITPEGLVRERVFEEWRKLILRGKKPSRGLEFLRACGWLTDYPELLALIDCPQDPEWHPEGDVWIHTLRVLDAYATERIGDDWEDLVVGLAALCHDLGKPATTAMTEDRWRSPGHEEAGVEPTRVFLERMTNQEQLFEEIAPLVREHLRPIMLFKADASASAIRRLARRVGRIDRLIRVCRADHAGRPPLPFDGFPAGAWLLERAAALDVMSSAPTPLILGRHLIELGLRPGPAFKPLLESCFEAQLDGRFGDLAGGLALLKELVANQGLKEASS
jgi:tRNA nucleotidyltransferase (CCA-adding enzyme)